MLGIVPTLRRRRWWRNRVPRGLLPGDGGRCARLTGQLTPNAGHVAVITGQVRFDLDDSGATISISIARNFRGQGLGPSMLRQACRCFWSQHPAVPVHAYIKPDNAASLKAFSRAGFVEAGTVLVHHQKAAHWTLQREDLP